MESTVDLLIENAKVYNTFTHSFTEKSVYIKDGRFLHISEGPEEGLSAIVRMDANGMHMIPGLIDIHMHIESSMTVPGIFSDAALPLGVTTVVADPHEIANVFGIEGIEAFMREDTLLDIFYGIPSSVPSTSLMLETTGGEIGLKEIDRLLDDPRVLCLGEVMNFKDIVSDEESLSNRIIRLCNEKRPTLAIEGHCPRVSGLDLSRFLYHGIDADHTQQSPESIYEKISNGMFLEMQEKSLTTENMKVLVENSFYEHFALITDDVMADKLLTGHLDRIVRKAIACGLPTEKAIYASTYTPSRRMGLRDRGSIAPGKLADFIFLEDLEEFRIHTVFKKGRKVERVQAKSHTHSFPDRFLDSIFCRRAAAADFTINASGTGTALVNCIAIQKVGTFTSRIQKKAAITGGFLDWESSGSALIAVMERYGKTGDIAYGLVDNAISERGAIATTWAHDHHNVMVMGTSKEDMVIAQNRLLDIKGGYVVVENGSVTAEARLEVGGIVSLSPIDELGRDLQNVREAMRRLGYDNTNEIMSFSTLSLPVSPEIKITDKGIMETRTQKMIPLIEEYLE
ncbi:adenine deaminase C-terminal domain-containing protein [Youngiibacter multivorans]|uniref:Adenine deaminase n=1 Tax=Youngiibacter multivorans TaxID=937251 RepID=A0ABS4G1U2_9CLOT|nr:adenine deaminase C-terminal domain-containing protein [Youngiibacter multivorans]MBP1918496.1 adenine deaminase [Youngiibacter multivorans]